MLRAQCLLAAWYLRMGRTLEGYATVCSTARFAVGCELNKIVSPVFHTPQQSPNASMQDLWQGGAHIGLGVGISRLATTAAVSASSPNAPLLDRQGSLDVFQSILAGNLTHPRNISLGFGTGLLPASSFSNVSPQPRAPGTSLALTGSSYQLPGSRETPEKSKLNPVLDAPKTARDLGERILLFWRIFNLDRFWSVVCGLQPALSEDEIMTVWPRTMEDYETV